MDFIDEARIEVAAGNGGPGSRHFRREKFVPLGGPDGGNGGHGGSVIIVADTSKHTLLDFKFQAKWQAEHGSTGLGSQKDGKSGNDLLIHVPVGTQVFNAANQTMVADLDQPGKEVVLSKGGRGGKGNAFFKTPTNRTPEHFQPGEPGESGIFLLSLKLVADVGLIGFPNAGKSTLISVISAARPKIADYPFTTLTPNLGMVKAKGGRSFVVADIPGLIPGASQGKGLGVKFLKHVERTRVLAHLIDPFQVDSNGQPIDPLTSFETINQELKAFSPELAEKSQLIVITKADLDPSGENLNEIQKQFSKAGKETIVISSASGTGIPDLIERLAQSIERLSK